MATWHQSQARKRGGMRLDHPTLWTLLHDPIGGVSSAMTYPTESAAYAALAALQAAGKGAGYMLLPPGKLTVYEPARGRNRAEYQAQIDAAEIYFREVWAPSNPAHARRTAVRVRWYSRLAGYAVTLAYTDTFTGSWCTVNIWFSR